MRIRLPLLFISTLIAICLVSSITQSQTRRRSSAKTKNTKVQQLVPLTLEQKRVVVDLIERAKSIELTYQTNPHQFATATDTLIFILDSDTIKQFPAGIIKTYLIGVVYGYRDAGALWGMLTGTGLADAFYGAQASTTGRDGRPQLIEEIGRRWNINVMRMGLRQAQRKIFNNASNLKDKLISLFARTPTADMSSIESNEWTFPKPGMKGEYSDVTKTIMYDLGQGFFAGHIELVPGVPAVAMFFFVPIPKEEVSKEVSQADLALVFASKAVKLSKLLSDTILEKEKDSEYRFRTASGKILIVALNPNREMAILRFE